MRNSKALLAILIIVIAVIGLAIFKGINESSEESMVKTGQEESGQAGENEDTDQVESETEDIEDNEKDTEPASQSENGVEEAAFDFYNADMDLDTLKEYNVPIIFTFGNKACIYCEEMKPGLAELNQKYQGQAIIKYVDTDEYPEKAKDYPIYGTPATVVIDSSGQPYSPSEDFEGYVYQFAKDGTDEPALSMIFGYIDKDAIDSLVQEMI